MIPRPRSALILILIGGSLGAQRPAPAQRGGTPNANTPQLVVSVLASTDPRLGVGSADAIRQRIQSEHSATDLYVVPRPKVDEVLRLSGYNPDSALGANDLVELLRQVHGDYALAGTVERTASGVRSNVRILTQTGAQIIAEPLAPIDGRDFGDIAKQVDRAVSEALRALTFYHDCTNGLRTGDYRQAMAAAQQGLRIRPTSAALNLCVLSILSATYAAPDSIIAVATAVTGVDSASVIAWVNLVDAFGAKGDSARALDAMRMLHRLQPTSVAATLRLVDLEVGARQFDAALAHLDTALVAAPGNVELLRKRWLLHLRLGHYAQALVSGAALVVADSSAATVDYYERELAAATGAHDTLSTRRIAVEASVRFPRNADFLLVLAHDAVDRGAPREALPLVDRVLSIEPANEVAWRYAITASALAEGTDSAVAKARRARAAGVPADPVGTSLLAVIPPLLAKARTSNARADWEAMFGAAQAVDSVAPSRGSAFYVGVSAFQIATDDIQSLADFSKRRSPTRAERQTACRSVMRLEELISVVNMAMPKGGSVEPSVASRVLAAVPGYSEFVSSVKHANCR
ncbi:MAG TPA: hypothetical protein VLN49_23780 [Gemmatimonadaceae bacterium]|nr:hypothetical protein [Gemmatimonadaceae bacterium]